MALSSATRRVTPFFAASVRGFVLFGEDRHCVNLHERAWASMSCGGNDGDGDAVIVHTDRDAAYAAYASTPPGVVRSGSSPARTPGCRD
jgi:hypothetical protein